MKTLSVQQPWATLICAGIKDVENRSWKTPHRGKVLIMASSKKVPRDFMNQIPVEWSAKIWMEQAMGVLPDFEDMPTGAIIGYVELEDCIESEEFLSMWSSGDVYQWKVKDAYMFDTPITGVKGKLNLWDYPDIDENNLPSAHKVVRQCLELEGTTLSMSLTDQLIDELLSAEDGSRVLDLEDDAEYTDRLFVDENGSKIKPIKKAVFRSATKTVEFEVKGTAYFTPFDENEKPIEVPSIYGEGKKMWTCIRLELGKQIQ